jgi:predicted SprT family Zn-dependent metalloprotease
MRRDWVKLELAVRTFDAAPFTRYAERCQTAGVRHHPANTAAIEMNRRPGTPTPGRTPEQPCRPVIR